MRSLREIQQSHLPQVEAEMVRFITEHTGHETLKESMLYSIQAGGKRLRPLMLLAAVASFGKEITDGAYQIAAALEMVHTYSLIHDDLPAMDNDDLRRGKPTNHVAFGEAMAILAGDGLLTEAFHLMSLAQVDAIPKILLLQQFSKLAGTSGMVAGQAADIQAEGKQLSIDEIAQIHQHKTGDLIAFAFVSGTVLAEQPEEVLLSVERFARQLGLAFQIRDDLLDATATTEELGKNTQRDQELAKSTYPALLGIDGARQALTQTLAAAQHEIDQLQTAADFHPQLFAEFIEKFRL